MNTITNIGAMDVFYLERALEPPLSSWSGEDLIQEIGKGIVPEEVVN